MPLGCLPNSRHGKKTSMFAYLVGIWYEWRIYAWWSLQCERLVLKEQLHCGRPRIATAWYHVLVQDGTGMEIPSADCMC